MHPSNKLFGRENEISILRGIYSDTCNGSFNVVIVRGASGTGKTALVNNLKDNIGNNTFFISGKFEKNNEDIPYSAFIKAFDHFIRTILSQPKSIVDKWRKKLKNTLGGNSGLVSAFINSLEFLIGKQRKYSETSLAKAKPRFSNTLIKFIQAFPEKEHPAILFLDDLQWADSASIDVLKSICSESSNNHLMVIATYRSDEVDEEHKIISLLSALKTDIFKTKYIEIENITSSNINDMVAENYRNLNCSYSALSKVIYKNTLGNPFYVSQFLKYIIDENYLYYCKPEWVADIHSLRRIEMDEDVVKLVLKRISKLDSIELLKTASYVGNTFSLKELEIVSDESIEKIQRVLKTYISNGFISVSDEYKTDNPRNIIYEFSHDKILQAIYAPIPNEEKINKHYHIGTILLDNYNEREIEENIIRIMTHFNAGFDMILPEDHIRLAALYLKAGKKALNIIAYQSALLFFINGKKLIDCTELNKSYDIVFNLNLEYAKAEYLCGDKLKAMDTFNLLIGMADKRVDLSTIHKTKMELLFLNGDYKGSIGEGIKALEYLGHKISRSPSKIDIFISLVNTFFSFRNSKLKTLINMKNSNKENTVIETLLMIATAGFQTEVLFFFLATLRLGIISIKNQNPKYASLSCLSFVVIKGFIFGNQKKTELLRDTAQILSEKCENDSALCLFNLFNALFINHWIAHANKSIKSFNDCINHGMSSGDYVYVSFAACGQIEYEFCIGVNINTLCKKSEAASRILRKLNSNIGLDFMLHFVDAITSIKTNNLDFFFDKQIEKSVAEVEVDYATYLLIKIIAFYVYEKYDDLIEVLDESLQYIYLTNGLIQSAEFAYINSLAITALYNSLSKSQRRRYKGALRKNLSSMKKWAEQCPENFLHKYYLMSAEINRVNKNNESARILYDRAIKSADENGYVQNCAIANELAGKFYRDMGNDKIAKLYFLEAHNNYTAWGATGKANLLNNANSLLKNKNSSTANDKEASISTNQDRNKLKKTTSAYKKILAEKNEAAQLKVFLSEVIGISSAQRAYLLIEKNEEMFILHYKDKETENIRSFDEIPLTAANNLPQSIIHYTERTFETIISDAIIKEDDIVRSIIASDNYLNMMKPYAFASIPIIISDGFLGVLYLENANKKEHFIHQDADIIKMLSQHIEIKINSSETNIKLAETLTKRELQVLKLIAKGLSNKDIANELYISAATVDTHIRKVFTKLGINKRVQATSIAISLGYQ